MKNGVIVDLQHIFFSYGKVVVLEDVSIKLKQNDFLSIIGPNGGGKTTILKIILGLIEPDKGNVIVFGNSPKAARKFIGYLPQLFTFDYDFPVSIMDVVLMGRLGKRGLGKKYTKEDYQICLEALAMVGMEHLKDTQIGDLSGGQRQRVFIARALSTNPKLLLLDEPVASVDTKWQQTFYELLQELNKKIAIIMVTHDISVVSTYIDKIACVNRRLYYHGSKKEGMHKISEMYECPVQLIIHDTPRGLSGENAND
ncbi:ABC transporter ATP-binding protein [candidate division WOR-3 bacterium]|nr:ABC transporter ATP-binding protein [candidate division WOR-3 bacterium]